MYRVDGRLVSGDFAFESLVFLLEVLDGDQVAPEVLTGNEKPLLANPGLFVVDVAEELVQRQGLSQLHSTLLHVLPDSVYEIDHR